MLRGTMNITVTAKINPTEDAEHVRGAVESLFPTIDIVEDEGAIVGTGSRLEDLESLKRGIESQAIRDTARSNLIAGSFGTATTLYLNRQAAVMGKVNISKDGPLGPIVVRITGELDKILDYIAPSTIEEKR